jgi:hypothetical protein
LKAFSLGTSKPIVSNVGFINLSGELKALSVLKFLPALYFLGYLDLPACFFGLSAGSSKSTCISSGWARVRMPRIILSGP